MKAIDTYLPVYYYNLIDYIYRPAYTKNLTLRRPIDTVFKIKTSRLFQIRVSNKYNVWIKKKYVMWYKNKSDFNIVIFFIIEYNKMCSL